MVSIVRHPHLVQKLFEGLKFVPPLAFSLLYLLVHYLDGHALVRQHIDSHFNSDLRQWYFENLPEPSLKTTRYFSSITGHRSKYSWGRSRMQFIV